MPKRPSYSKGNRPLNVRYMAGQPGYRTRQGRTGLDPMDAYREEGLFIGIILRKLLRGQARTRNLLLISLMLVFGLCALGFVLASLTVPLDPQGNNFSPFLLSLVFLIPVGLIGLMCLVNAAASISDLLRGQPASGQDKHIE